MRPTHFLRRVVPALIALAVGVLCTVVAATPAAAHAVIVGTDPADGAVLDTAPTELTVLFNEPVRPNDAGTSVRFADGTKIPTTVATVDTAVVIALPDGLADGTYVVAWRVTSLDGHPIPGAFTFAIGAPSQQVVNVDISDDESLSPAVWAAQALTYVGILGAAGLLMFQFLFLPAAGAELFDARARLSRVRTGFIVTGVIGLVLSAPIVSAWQLGHGIGDILDGEVLRQVITSQPGMAAGIGLVGLALIGVFADRAGVALRNRLPLVLAAAGAVIALLSQLVVGHTRTVQPAWLVVSADVLHLLAGAIWFGGVVGLVIALRRASQAGQLARVVARFSSAAAWVVLALAVTGVVLGWRILGGFEPLFDTRYGLTLIIKVGVAGLIVAIAAWNKFRLVPQIDAAIAAGAHNAAEGDAPAALGAGLGLLRRAVIAEAGLLVAVLAVTGVLVSQSPASSAAAPADPGGVYEMSNGAAAHVEVVAGAGFERGLHFKLVTATGAPLEPAAEPQLAMFLRDLEIGPLAVEVAEHGPGEYQATFTAPLAGNWEAEFAVRSTKYQADTVVVTIPVN